MSQRESLNTETVLKKALELAKENGIDSVTYNGLARELGIRPQSMYRYVPNIKALRVSILSMILFELVDALKKKIKDLTPTKQLKAFALGMYDECHAFPWYYQAFQLMHQYDIIPELSEPLTALVDLVQKAMTQLTTNKKEAARKTQLFVAINLGYAQMSMTRFIPASLADNRKMFIQSVDEFLKTL